MLASAFQSPCVPCGHGSRGPILIIYGGEPQISSTRCAYMHHLLPRLPQGENDQRPYLHRIISPWRHNSRTTLSTAFYWYLWYRRASFQRCASSLLGLSPPFSVPLIATPSQNLTKELNASRRYQISMIRIDLQANTWFQCIG